MITGMVAAVLGCTALAIAPGVAVGFLALVAIGIALVPALPIVLELTERRTGEADGLACGLIWMAGNLGGLVVATVVGLLVDLPATAFLVTAAAALVGVPCAISLRHHIAELPSLATPTAQPGIHNRIA